MIDRLTLRIADDGSLSREGEAMTIKTLEQRLEEDKANNVDTLIVANASQKAEWTSVHQALQLLMRFDRTLQGFVGTGQ
jgi:biopolymer transport protein ExbD